MNLEPFIDQALLLALIFLRIASALAVMPFFGYRGIPVIAKAGLSITIALIIFPGVQTPAGWTGADLGLFVFISLAVAEIVTGILVGMVTHFIFYGVELSGQYLGVQMGFGIVNVVDPSTEQQISIIGQLQYLFAILIFLTFNGHHFLLAGLQETFSTVPVGGFGPDSGLLTIFIKLMGDLFVAGIKIAAPVMAAILLSEVALGIVARTVPQMNVFIVGFPLKIGLGLLALALSMPMFVYILKLLWKNFQSDWWQFIGLLGP
ncbi:flagellar biosynthetic protein FliR [candidate division LCP-89 bacterium B3_LCP]|uniref:Flagellar biosynthetic protein FliR n=1 Tax=candidate division LCP-89 bacterium B3_LCP TaxID=2012998 RepID=A0A532V528_UNCL8|nr:MAG: flagellar biosynthetic protein FliR [candidate division LCP-89 bacterium B3_LCP]